MYKKSPVKLFGNVAAALASRRRSSGGGIPESVLNGVMGRGGQLGRALGTSQAAQAAAQESVAATNVGSSSSAVVGSNPYASVGSAPSGDVGQDQDNRVQQAPPAVNESAATGVGSIPSGAGGPAGSSNPFGGQKFEITPVQMTYDTPTPGNEMGSAAPLFNKSVTDAGNIMFGDVGQRQRSLTNQAGDIQSKQYVKDPSALQGNAFGLAMEQAGGDYDKAKEIIKNK